MTEYTQSQAYKHLLQVAQNIIYSSEIEDQIVKKYEQLKKSILKKVSKEKDNHRTNIVSVYRLLIDNTIKVVQAFQEQLQHDMQRGNYNSLILELNQGVDQKIQQLSQSIQNNSSKMRLMHKDQINTLKYQFDQMDAKYENLGLLIQVHKKMHEIILEATKAQQKRFLNEQKERQKIRQLQNSLKGAFQINEFINQHKITEQKYVKFKLAAKSLNKILFN